MFNVCYFCGHIVSWGGDHNYDEVYGEGEGVVSNYTCTNPECGAHIEVSLRTDEEDW